MKIIVGLDNLFSVEVEDESQIVEELRKKILASLDDLQYEIIEHVEHN